MEPEHYIFVEFSYPLLERIRLTLPLGVRTAIRFKRDTGLLRQITQSLREIYSLLLLNESKDVSTLLPAEATPGLPLRKDMQRWRTLIMKRAMPLQRFARFP